MIVLNLFCFLIYHLLRRPLFACVFILLFFSLSYLPVSFSVPCVLDFFLWVVRPFYLTSLLLRVFFFLFFCSWSLFGPPFLHVHAARRIRRPVLRDSAESHWELVSIPSGCSSIQILATSARSDASCGTVSHR